MSRIRRAGVSVEVPTGWEAAAVGGAEFQGLDTDGSRQMLTLHVASFPLPADMATFGASAVERMGPDDVMVMLVEYGPESANTPLFAHQGIPRLEPGMFSRDNLHRTLPGQSGTQFFFTHEGRAFCLYVVLGSHIDRADLVPKANAIVESLEIS
ncbi:MAG TPA: hypothetical protein VF246_05755 [Acidimicrobiia bacterium]